MINFYRRHTCISGFTSFDVYSPFRPNLPDYELNFGYVILGTVRTHIVRATNPGILPISFSVEHTNLSENGFNVELDRVRQLPGAPDYEPIDFVVSFDPRGANLQIGDVETVVPIHVRSINLLHNNASILIFSLFKSTEA